MEDGGGKADTEDGCADGGHGEVQSAHDVAEESYIGTITSTIDYPISSNFIFQESLLSSIDY